MKSFLAEFPEILNKEIFEKMNLFSKKKRFHLLKSLLYKNGKAPLEYAAGGRLSCFESVRMSV